MDLVTRPDCFGAVIESPVILWGHRLLREGSLVLQVDSLIQKVHRVVCVDLSLLEYMMTHQAISSPHFLHLLLDMYYFGTSIDITPVQIHHFSVRIHCSLSEKK